MRRPTEHPDLPLMALKRVPETKEIKVKMRTDQYHRLYSLKILRGKNISEAVQEALDAYLERFVTSLNADAEKVP